MIQSATVKCLGCESTACLCLSAVIPGQIFSLQLFKISFPGLVDVFKFNCSVTGKHLLVEGKKKMDVESENKKRERDSNKRKGRKRKI